MPIFLLAGALLGAAAGGALGYTAAGLSGVALGVGVGALAGVGFGAAAYAFSRPVVLTPIPFPQSYGYYGVPVVYAGPPLYYTTA
jgi:hypothetical protein